MFKTLKKTIDFNDNTIDVKNIGITREKLRVVSFTVDVFNSFIRIYF